MWQWEQHEQAQGVSREYEYRLGKRYHCSRGCVQSNMYKVCSKLANKLNSPELKRRLQRPCNRRAAEHSCLNGFRTDVGFNAAMRWRKLWYALPKEDRMNRLIQMYRAQWYELPDHMRADFKMQYRVLGMNVCRDAFIAVTGMHADTLQAARKVATMQATQPVPSSLIWVGRRPLAYRDARAWLLDYAKTHGDTSPMSTLIYLPWGRKQFYWSSYFRCRQQVGVTTIAGYNLFCKVWRTELPWISIRTCTGPFTHCGLCDFLKACITAAVDSSIKHSLLMRLGAHYDFQAAQRNALNLISRESERDASELLYVGWDKMDQQKMSSPAFKL